jgi:hypothetical protein
MNHTRNTLLVIAILLSGGILAFILFSSNATKSMNHDDLRTVLTTTTATFGSLLGIITAGLMFTHGKFSELASELDEKAPDYLSETLSLEKVQQTGTLLLALRKAFLQLETETTVAEEKNLYRKITEGISSMFVDFAVLLNIKLRQQGLRDTDFMVSEMDPSLHARYQETRKTIRKEWQVLEIIKKIVDTWEGPISFIGERPETRTSLQANLKSASTILKLKEKIDKNPKNIGNEVAQALEDLGNEISKIGKMLHQDRIPQLLSQMDYASTIRGKYFYLALVFIATPLFVNLIILPQLSEGTSLFFQPIISATSSLSMMGVIFLLLYIHKILNV